MTIDHHFLAGGGEMGALMRAKDWSATPLGPVDSWPQSLRSCVSILLPSKAQIVLFWGPELVALYNDSYRPVFGAKHPAALGMPAREAWSEIWEDRLKQLFEGVLNTGEAFWGKDLLFILERNGFPEETFFDVSYDPVRDESGKVGGIFCIVNETSGHVVGERRMALLKDLAARNAAARTVREACVLAMETLAAKPQDITFALTYVDGELQAGTPGAEAAVRASSPGLVRELAIGSAKLKLGLNPQRPFDAQYRAFLDLVADQVASGIANAQAYEEERKRAEALAEIDRAKTAFFSNVSHEFRTPLTLMLGPVDDILAKSQDAVLTEDRALLMTVQRNGQRLLKLVNTLLDFARIEAGRAQASFEPIDLAAFTAELASNFRSACERAGLKLTVDCPGGTDAAFVDREMWEKVVLNLVSNAFKFTLAGEISVRLRDAGASFELTVRDTGSGIPQEELPRMFERFHRVEGARGRSHEGSGIGLALVQELVRLHGGTIGVESALGKGATFMVSIPKGRDHLPGKLIKGQSGASTAGRANAYVQEAMSWLGAEDAPAPARGGNLQRVLVADDNADLRDYVYRLLAEHYEVEAVPDGEAALAAARARRPDLVVTDVMMPGLDGFGLLRELRADAALRTVPVILLSARAGEEARIEGLDKGADDYVVKPFSARELLVRVGALLRSADIRKHAEHTQARLAAIVESSDDAIISKDLNGIIKTWNAGARRLFGYTAEEAIGRPITMLMPPEQADEEPGILARIRRGESIDHYETIRRRKDGSLVDISLSVSPLFDEQGRAVGASKIARDITGRKRAEQALREADRRKDEFLATLSHELRNPLAPICNALDLLDKSDGDTRVAAQARGILSRQVRNLVRLVDDLLELSRISRGTIVLRKEEADLADVVATAVEASRPAIEAAGHVLDVVLPDGPVKLHADPVRITQVFTNLLNNAAKFTDLGGRIRLSAEADAREVTVSVKDSGIGIAPEVLPRVFDMFVQAADGRAHIGLGIGLSLARSLVEMHEGTIEGRSEGLGHGSEFVVRLPTLAASRAATSAAADETAPGAPRRAASGS